MKMIHSDVIDTAIHYMNTASDFYALARLNFEYGNMKRAVKWQQYAAREYAAYRYWMRRAERGLK